MEFSIDKNESIIKVAMGVFPNRLQFSVVVSSDDLFNAVVWPSELDITANISTEASKVVGIPMCSCLIIPLS